MDDNGNGSLDMQEFTNAIKDFNIELPEIDIANSFKAFDLNHNGEIEYDEFVKVLLGPMNAFRTRLVEKAFDKLDSNQVGLIDVILF